MGRNTNPALVVVAGLTGVAAGYAQVRRCTRIEALAEIAEILDQARRRTSTTDRRGLLSRAAASFVDPSGPGAAAWHPHALSLLVEAGADIALAEQLHAELQSRSPNVAANGGPGWCQVPHPGGALGA